MKKIKVFIDTNGFDSECYDLSVDKKLDILCSFVQDDKVEVLLNDIIIKESLLHIERGVVKAVNKMKEIFKAHKDHLSAVNILKIDPSFCNMFNLNNSKVKLKSKGIFDNFVIKLKPTMLDNSIVDINKIISDYFEGVPPFNESNKEFPDAIWINSLTKYIESEKQLVHVVTNDGQVIKNLEKNKFIKLHKDIGTFLNELNLIQKEELRKITDNIPQCIKNNLDSIKLDITKRVSDTLSSLEIDGNMYDRKGSIGGYDYDDIDDINIDRVEEVELVTINAVQDKYFTVTIKCNLDITAICSFLDESQSYWDSDIKDYYFSEYGKVEEKHEIEVTLDMKIFYLFESEILELDGIEILEDDMPACLDEETRISQKLMLKKDPDNLSIDFLYRYKCPFCGENFSKNLEDYVEGSSSDERSMGEHIEYDILCEDACPKCNENFKIEGTLYEYPVGIKNFDEIKIYWENEKTDENND